MAPSANATRTPEGTEIVRARLLTSLHLGRLGPGDRVPSVRRLADLTGLNRKTIHRAYKILVKEGLLDVRPGSGTFVARRGRKTATAAPTQDLVSAIARMRATAAALRLAPSVFASFIQAALGCALAGTRVAVVECNREQAGMIEADLVRHLGVAPFRVLLARLRNEGARALQGAQAVITTHCHLEEATERSQPLGLAVHAVSLDSTFPRLMIDLARGHRRLVMIVHDPEFGPVFFHLLRQLGIADDELDRIEVVQAARASEMLNNVQHGTRVWLSPLVRHSLRFLVPRHVHLVPESWHVPRQFLERVHAELALDHACCRTGVS